MNEKDVSVKEPTGSGGVPQGSIIDPLEIDSPHKQWEFVYPAGAVGDEERIGDEVHLCQFLNHTQLEWLNHIYDQMF